MNLLKKVGVKELEEYLEIAYTNGGVMRVVVSDGYCRTEQHLTVAAISEELDLRKNEALVELKNKEAKVEKRTLKMESTDTLKSLIKNMQNTGSKKITHNTIYGWIGSSTVGETIEDIQRELDNRNEMECGETPKPTATQLRERAEELLKQASDMENEQVNKARKSYDTMVGIEGAFDEMTPTIQQNVVNYFNK